MKRLLCVLATLGLVFAILVTMPTQKADAISTWPQEFSDTGITQVVAHGEDDLTLLSCDFTSVPSVNSFTIVTNGSESSNYPQDRKFSCDPRTSDITNPDGTVYGTYTDNSSSTQVVYLLAAKNGRIKWSVSLNYDSGCSGVAGVGSAPTSMSIGSDGNLYFIEANGQYTPFCNQYLLGVNSETGTIINRVNLGKFTNYLGVKPSVWTYDDKIVTVDTAGVIHQYGYGPSYTEISGADANYQFPGAPASGTVLANATGDVYLIGDCGGNIYSHGHDGVNVSIARTDSCYGERQNYIVGPAGDVIGYYDSGLAYNYHMQTSPATYTANAPAIPSGYAKAHTYYASPYLIEDSSGNIIQMLQLTQNGTGYPAVSIVYIDNATGNTTNLYTRTGDDTPTGNAIAGRPDVYGGFMYLPVAHGSVGGGSTNTHSFVEKIALGSFGLAVKSKYGFATSMSTKRNYVAMGDSFSSGEGNSPFEFGTDANSTSTAGENRCHRSDVSYPRFLISDASLNLNLTDFTACSGAVTDNVLNGGSSTGSWNEPAQIKALSSSAQIVTITIGGNDIGFSEVLNACVHKIPNAGGFGCSADTTLQSNLNDRLAALAGSGAASIGGHDIHPLVDVYRAIHLAAPSAAIYVGGYPHMFGSDINNYSAVNDSSIPGSAVCAIIPGATFSYGDAQWINSEADALNSAIHSAVVSVREEGVDIKYIPAAFGGHALCDSGDSWLYGALIDSSGTGILPGSMHPDHDGQRTGYEIPFALLMN